MISDFIDILNPLNSTNEADGVTAKTVALSSARYLAYIMGVAGYFARPFVDSRLLGRV